MILTGTCALETETPQHMANRKSSDFKKPVVVFIRSIRKYGTEVNLTIRRGSMASSGSKRGQDERFAVDGKSGEGIREKIHLNHPGRSSISKAGISAASMPP